MYPKIVSQILFSTQSLRNAAAKCLLHWRLSFFLRTRLAVTRARPSVLLPPTSTPPPPPPPLTQLALPSCRYIGCFLNNCGFHSTGLICLHSYTYVCLPAGCPIERRASILGLSLPGRIGVRGWIDTLQQRIFWQKTRAGDPTHLNIGAMTGRKERTC